MHAYYLKKKKQESKGDPEIQESESSDSFIETKSQP